MHHPMRRCGLFSRSVGDHHAYCGRNDWGKEQSAKLSDQGYVALAIDLYRGKVARTPDEAHEIMRGVPGLVAAFAGNGFAVGCRRGSGEG